MCCWSEQLLQNLKAIYINRSDYILHEEIPLYRRMQLRTVTFMIFVPQFRPSHDLLSLLEERSMPQLLTRLPTHTQLLRTLEMTA
jgi:hypothetical protein